MTNILLLTLLFFGVIRNTLVFLHGMTQIERVRQWNVSNYLKERKNYPEGWKEYMTLLFDLRKWTFKQFYPEWDE